MRLKPPNFEETPVEMFERQMSVSLEPSLNVEKTISNREICSKCFRSLLRSAVVMTVMGYVESNRNLESDTRFSDCREPKFLWAVERIQVADRYFFPGSNEFCRYKVNCVSNTIPVI
jgi:hypothetical protein